MKNLVVLSVFLFLSLPAFAQDFAAYNKLSMSAPKDYKTLEPKILEAATFLFSHPIDEEKDNRQNALAFIMKWMEGTPDYTFSIGQEAMELTKGSSDLLGLYLAAMSKAVLENLTEPLSDQRIHELATEMLMQYTADKKNGLKPNKALKKLMKEKS